MGFIVFDLLESTFSLQSAHTIAVVESHKNVCWRHRRCETQRSNRSATDERYRTVGRQRDVTDLAVNDQRMIKLEEMEAVGDGHRSNVETSVSVEMRL